jgi:antibiotic biosynthesis monooxygenase (ABM) superfamily enzyme
MKVMAHKEKQISKTNETGEYARKISIAATINVTFSLILSQILGGGTIDDVTLMNSLFLALMITYFYNPLFTILNPFWWYK